MTSHGPGLLNALKWSYGASLFTAAANLIVVMVLARLLTPESFGAYAILLSVIGIGTLVLSFGLGAAIVQHPQLTRKHLGLALTASGCASAVGAIGIALTAPFIGARFHAPAVGPVLIFGGPILIFNALNAIGIGLVRRAMDFRWLALTNALTFLLVYTPIAVCLALAGAGVWSLVCGYAGESLVRSVALLRYYRNMPPLERDQHSQHGAFICFGLKTSVHNALHAVEGTFINFAILNAFGLTALGIFNRVNRIREITQDRIAASSVSVIFSHFSRVFGAHGDLKTEFRRTYTLLNTIVMPIFCGAAVSSEVIVQVVLGDHYGGGAGLLKWLFLMVPFVTNQGLASNIVTATGRLSPAIVTQTAFLLLFFGAVVIAPIVELERFVLLWFGLVVGRFFLYCSTAIRTTDLRLSSFLWLHLLGAWQTTVVCSALLVAHRLLKGLSPSLTLLILIIVGAVAMGLGFLLAPSGIYEKTLIRSAFRLTESRLAPVRRLLVLKFGNTPAWAAP